MAKITFYGFDDYALKLQHLEKKISQIEGEAIYSAAGIVADEVKASIDEIHAEYAYEIRTVEVQKKGLKEGLGIATIRDDGGFRNVRVGFDGYNDVKTRKYPKGQPNIMIARSYNSGSSWRSKQPFFDKAVRRVRAKAEEIMKTTVEGKIDKLMKE